MTDQAAEQVDASAPIPMVDRRYLRGRHMGDPVEAYRATREVLDGWRTLRLKTALGKTFRHTERVSMHRPRWMPRRLYLWLLSTIVFEEPAAQAEEASRA